MPSLEDVVVFTDTNLRTSIAVAVNPDIRIEDFKRELEKTHLGCFPDIGKIRVHGVMVKRKSCLYNLPDSVPIKYAFQDLVGSWFLRAQVTVLNGSGNPDLSKRVAAEVEDNGSSLTHKIKHLQQEIPKASSICAKMSKKRKTESSLEIMDKFENEISSVSISVHVNKVIPSMDNFGFMSSPDSKVLGARSKAKRHRVGNRILTASNKIKTSVNKRKHALSFCGTMNKKLARCLNSTCPIRYLVFEISDSDD